MDDCEERLTISTPGRICLFGEHQDYLNLPIIAAAISKRIYVEGTLRVDRKVNIDLPDIRRRESFEIKDKIPYVKERDYFRSVINVLQKKGHHFSQGFDCTVHGDIPINAGTSSSSALVVGWTHFLLRINEELRSFSPEDIAQIAYEAEVLEFTEPGGMMDQFTTAKGGLIWLESFPTIKLSSIHASLKSFILGNSHQPKDTKYVLANVKNKMLGIINLLSAIHVDFSIQTVNLENLHRFRAELTEDQFSLLSGTVRNRDISFEAKKVLEELPLDHKRIGELLNEHQAVLRDALRISTPKIDRMIEAALESGAYGAKINGSGGGGCMFAYAPENPAAVAEAIRSVSEAAIVDVDEGTRVDSKVSVS